MAIKVSDKVFFTQLLDYSLEGLADVKKASDKEDFSLCRKLFAEYIRETLQPEKLFSARLRS